jgi:metallophosphoesterase (TIGR00282 family)
VIRLLAIGDVIGRPGRNALRAVMPKIQQDYNPEIIILNGENAAGGFGLTEKIYDELTKDFPIDCITMGNHWHDKKEIFTFAARAPKLVLPGNMGNVREENDGMKVFTSKNGHRFAVVNLIGRVFMVEGNRNPFETALRLLEKVPTGIKLRFVDVHAEASSEKQGLGYFLAGKVSALYGTHSHVPTADDRVLEGYTGFITDLGMTGAYDSIIGMRKELALKRFLTGVKEKLEPAKDDPWFCAVVFDLDEESGKCLRIEPLRWRLNQMGLSTR